MVAPIATNTALKLIAIGIIDELTHKKKMKEIAEVHCGQYISFDLYFSTNPSNSVEDLETIRVVFNELVIAVEILTGTESDKEQQVIKFVHSVLGISVKD